MHVRNVIKHDVARSHDILFTTDAVLANLQALVDQPSTTPLLKALPALANAIAQPGAAGHYVALLGEASTDIAHAVLMDSRLQLVGTQDSGHFEGGAYVSPDGKIIPVIATFGVTSILSRTKHAVFEADSTFP